MLNYVTHLAPPPNCLIGGDFNAWHDMFEPGVQSVHQGAELARWAGESGMDFIGTPGVPTQRAGHVLDLTFSNIPFAQSTVRLDMHSGSDHETQVTTIPGRGHTPLEQHNYRIPDSDLPKFAGLIQNGIASLTPLTNTLDLAHIDRYAAAIAEVFNTCIQTVGKPDRGTGNPAPWWTPQCQEAHQRHLLFRNSIDDSPSETTREFHRTVRQAKREYWKHIINGVKDDKALYKVIGWHKLALNLKAPPLTINGHTIEDTIGKAEALRTSILERYSDSDDLPTDPLSSWNGPGHLPWNQGVSLEEMERNTIGVSSTSPGTDKVTVRLLKACWEHIKTAIHDLYNRCLAANHFPQSWKLAEVAMLPKVGKKDRTSPRS